MTSNHYPLYSLQIICIHFALYVCIYKGYINTTSATSGIAYPSGAHVFIPAFSVVRVAQSLGFFV